MDETRILTALIKARAVIRNGAVRFNPNHDAHTGKFTSGGSGETKPGRKHVKGFKPVEPRPRKPVVFYHGSTEEFKTLKAGSYVSPNINVAKEYGHIIYKFEAHPDRDLYQIAEKTGTRAHFGELEKGTVSQIMVQHEERFEYAITHVEHVVEIHEKGEPGLKDWGRSLRFNPNHDPATGEFSSGGSGSGSGKLAKRIRHRDRLRAELHKQAKELKEQHRDDWKEIKKEQRRDRKKLVATHRREHAKVIKKAHTKLEKLKASGTAKERNQVRVEVKQELSELKEQQAYERGVMKESQKSDRDRQKEYHKDDWDSFRFSMSEDIKDAGFKQKAKRSLIRKLVFAPTRLHKASSAEAILKTCLRQLGFTTKYHKGQLSGAQHIELLEEIRQYTRAWLRHEADQFIGHYVHASRDLAPDQGLERKLVWTPGPEGYLYGEDKGFIANVGRFFRRVKTFIRESIIAGVMSLLGPAPLTGGDHDAAEREARKQEQFFDKFESEVQFYPPSMTPREFIARAEKYGDSAWQAPQRINRARALYGGRFQFERRVLGKPKTEHCEDCPPLAALGWQPIGTLPHIGESECGPRCLCHFEWTDAPGNQAYKQGSVGPVLAPETPEMLPDDDEVHMVAEPPGGLQEPVPIAGPPK